MSDSLDILLATYNGSRYLQQQIESIQKQQNSYWRIIVRDDGSTDSTAFILQQYQDALQDRLLWLKDTDGNLGPSGNFSRLLNCATAPYILFADQDDVWLPNKIEVTFKAMRKAEMKYGEHIPLLVHSDLIVTDAELQVIDRSFWHYQHIQPNDDSLNRLLVQNVVTGCSMMINRATLNYLHHIPKAAIMHDWWIALVCAAFGKIIYINEPLQYYRQHAKNDTGAKQWNLSFMINSMANSKESIRKKRNQAFCFLECYQDQLDSHHIAILKAFAKPSDNALKKRFDLLRYRLLMHGFARNIGLFLFI